MGICGNKGGDNSTSKIKQMAFSMMVKSGGGTENDNQFSALKSMVNKQFPKANIKEEVDVNSGEDTFEIEMDGEKIHSKAIDGTVEKNQAGIMDKVKNILMQKMKTLI